MGFLQWKQRKTKEMSNPFLSKLLILRYHISTSIKKLQNNLVTYLVNSGTVEPKRRSMKEERRKERKQRGKEAKFAKLFRSA